MADHLDEQRLRRLIDVGRGLLSQLDPEAVLDQVLETARELTGARYAALGVLDRDRRELERFITQGIDAETHRAIGDLPRGRGILGVLIDSPEPLRIPIVGDHPKSYGFPPGHPPMSSFLGVPVLVRGQVWGNLYLTEKEGGAQFDAVDEESVMILAAWTAIAIENARLYEAVAARRDELEQSARRLEASRTIAVALGAEMELENVLELIAKRGRALVEARSLVILLREGDDLVIAASAGVTARAIGGRVPIAESTTGAVLESRTVQRIDDVHELRISPAQLGVADARTALIAPLIYRGRGLGVLAAFDRGADADGFTEDDEVTLRAFAASGATAVALAQSVQHERLRHSMNAAEAERRRWARELHDETLQGLGGLRVILSSALRRIEEGDVADLLREGVGQVEREIENLRAIITELRPAALDELGLAPAIDALVARMSTVEGLTIDTSLDVDVDGGAERLDEEIETTVYRLVQEALTNVAKHAGAEHARVYVSTAGGRLEIEVADDGAGFDAESSTAGFGLAGMRERVELSGGEIAVTPSSSGTTVRAVIPLPAPEEDVREGAAQHNGA
jgi:signal transduction histidine kinase